MESAGNGVMKPREPMAKGTIGGTGAAPAILHAQSRVPSPPSVATRSSAVASGAGHVVMAAAASPGRTCHVRSRPPSTRNTRSSTRTCKPHATL